jgi:hypothetical protein
MLEKTGDELPGGYADHNKEHAYHNPGHGDSAEATTDKLQKRTYTRHGRMLATRGSHRQEQLIAQRHKDVLWSARPAKLLRKSQQAFSFLTGRARRQGITLSCSLV